MKHLPGDSGFDKSMLLWWLSAFLLVLGTHASATAAAQSVSVKEVHDYSPGKYPGALKPSPPHADLNPHRALVIQWPGLSQEFVFSHEVSYCPYIELPSGAAMSNQFFEGNLGEAELMNSLGRKEKNSFVDVIEATDERVWVRWDYFAVNMHDDTQPRLRGIEDYFAHANGLILRRASYISMMPSEVIGYGTTPVELFGIAPQGVELSKFLTRDPIQGDCLAMMVMKADIVAQNVPFSSMTSQPPTYLPC